MEKLLQIVLKDNVNNLSILLYNSYKTAILTPSNPVYTLTDKDDSSQSAINYYRLNLSNSVSLVTTTDKSLETDKVNSTLVDPTVTVDTTNNNTTGTPTSEGVSTDLTDEEVKLKLDLEIDLDDIKNAIRSVNPDAHFGRKGKSSIINEFYDEYKSELIKLVV